jgi:Ca-activated chloride channel family protein
MNNEFNIDDPRLTAYALGELNGEDALEIERWLESDLSRRVAVDEICAAAGLIERELQAEASPGLTEAQRKTLMEQPAEVEVVVSSRRLIFRRAAIWGGALAVAACVAVLMIPQFNFGGAELKSVVMNDRAAGVDRRDADSHELGQRFLDQDLSIPQTVVGAPIGQQADHQELVLETKARIKAGQLVGPIEAHRSMASMNEYAPELSNDRTASGGVGYADASVGTGLGVPASLSPADEERIEAEMWRLQAMAAAPSPPPAPSTSVAGGISGRVGGGGGFGGGARGMAAPGRPPAPADSGPSGPAERSGMMQYPEQISQPMLGDIPHIQELWQHYTATCTGDLVVITDKKSDGTDAVLYHVTTSLTPQQIQSMTNDDVRAAILRVSLAEGLVRDPAIRQRLLNQRRCLIERLKSVPDAEAYNLITDNPFLKPTDEPLSTFSIDVDTASYSNVRRFLNSGGLPPKDAVRIEELINYFNYDYELPSGEDTAPFSANVEVNAAPWNPEHRLVRIGLRGKDVPADMRPATSLVFLIDVSGSMQPANKLPLVRDGLKLLVEKLNGDDRLAIVTYAGNAGLMMDSVYVNDEDKPRILAAIDGLSAGGSTNGAGGLGMAYDVATNHFIKDGVNRVILCTDGDFNVGVSNDNELVRLIEAKCTTGVFLSVLGFGTGNFKDGKMEQLANHGNGAFAYIDSLDEAKRTLVDRLSGTLVTIAKDVKIQIEFNPAKVAAFRLIGYENRVLAAQDFNNDRKDAGEIGAGHTVTALYEIVPPGVAIDPNLPEIEPPPVDELKYQRPVDENLGRDALEAERAKPQAAAVLSEELLTLKLRYKLPNADESSKLEIPVTDAGATAELATPEFQFAAAVAGFGLILRDSPYKGSINLETVLDLAGAALGKDADGKRAEFVQLVEMTRAMMPAPAPKPE